jgi:hypothetical protein
MFISPAGSRPPRSDIDRPRSDFADLWCAPGTSRICTLDLAATSSTAKVCLLGALCSSPLADLIGAVDFAGWYYRWANRRRPMTIGSQACSLMPVAGGRGRWRGSAESGLDEGGADSGGAEAGDNAGRGVEGGVEAGAVLEQPDGLSPKVEWVVSAPHRPVPASAMTGVGVCAALAASVPSSNDPVALTPPISRCPASRRAAQLWARRPSCCWRTWWTACALIQPLGAASGSSSCRISWLPWPSGGRCDSVSRINLVGDAPGWHWFRTPPGAASY